MVSLPSEDSPPLAPSPLGLLLYLNLNSLGFIVAKPLFLLLQQVFVGDS